MVPAGGGADDGEDGGGGGEGHGGDDDVGDLVGTVEVGDGVEEGGEGGYFDGGEGSGKGFSMGCHWMGLAGYVSWTDSASNWLGRMRSASRRRFW